MECRDLMKALKFVLGVQKIWCDSYTDKANQQFVEWAAKLIDKRCECSYLIVLLESA